MISSVLPCLRPIKAIPFFGCLFTINFAVSQTDHLSAGQAMLIGSNYKVGIYFIDMMQGKMRKQLKLIKQ